MLAGPVDRPETVPSIQGTNDGRVRERLTAAGVMDVSEAGTITSRGISLPHPQQRGFSPAGPHRQWLAGMEKRPGTHPEPGETGMSSRPCAFARSSLISPAVTGQIDVRGLVPEASAA